MDDEKDKVTFLGKYVRVIVKKRLHGESVYHGKVLEDSENSLIIKDMYGKLCKWAKDDEDNKLSIYELNDSEISKMFGGVNNGHS